MTAKDNTCDICGHNDHFAGVASSSLGPISLAFCGICVGMRAEQKFMIDMVYDPEMGNFRAQYPKESWVYYEKERDAYINYGTSEVMVIQFKGGKEAKTRSGAVEILKEIAEERELSEKNDNKT